MRAFALCIGMYACTISLSYAADFTTVLHDADGTVLQDCSDAIVTSNECKQTRPLTLGIAAWRALSFPEQNLSPEESFKRGHLGMKLYNAKTLDVSAEDIALIKRQIAKRYSPVVSAAAFPLLDPSLK